LYRCWRRSSRRRRRGLSVAGDVQNGGTSSPAVRRRWRQCQEGRSTSEFWDHQRRRISRRGWLTNEYLCTTSL